MSSSDDEDIPDVATCDRLCKEFALVTSTDAACAQYYLQDRKWNLERSINDFFEDRNSGNKVRPVGQNPGSEEVEVLLVVNDKKESVAAAATAVMTQAVTSYARQCSSTEVNLRQDIPRTKDSPEVLKLISWNIDGLDTKNRKIRTKAVCDYVKEVDADVVFLQEVVPQTLEQIQSSLPNYKCLVGGAVCYFTAMLLKNQTVWYMSHEIQEYPSSCMERNLLACKVKVGEKKLLLLNGHLESTADGAMERKSQLKTAFNRMCSSDNDFSVIFAGDLNLREKELTELGGIPRGVEDVWITCGSRKECAYTWDMTRNDNLIINGKFKPRARYDRLYLKRNNSSLIVPTFFGLIGLTRLSPHRCFPSDHWGLLSFFDITQ